MIYIETQEEKEEFELYLQQQRKYRNKTILYKKVNYRNVDFNVMYDVNNDEFLINCTFRNKWLLFPYSDEEDIKFCDKQDSDKYYIAVNNFYNEMLNKYHLKYN